MAHIYFLTQKLNSIKKHTVDVVIKRYNLCMDQFRSNPTGESGNELYKRAYDKENSFFKIFYDDYTYEEIGTTYKLAGDKFRLAKDWVNAITSYKAAIRLYSKTYRLFDTMEIYEIIANIYSKQLNDHVNAIKVIEEGITKSARLNKFDITGNLYKVLGGLHELNGDYVQAITIYGLGFDAYSNTKYHKRDAKYCLVRVAELYCTTERYNYALDKYKELFQLSGSTRVPYIEEFVIVRAILCYLIEEDLVGAKKWFGQLNLVRPNVSKFLSQLLVSLENGDKELFENNLSNYSLTNPLDGVDTLLLTKIRFIWFNTYDNVANNGKTTNAITDDWT